MSMLQVIQGGAARAVAAEPQAFLGCPGCGHQPSVKASFFGQVCVYCDSDDCPGIGDGWPQAMDTNLALATAKWNAQAQRKCLDCPGADSPKCCNRRSL